MLQIHDEFNTLCDSLGLYKAGGANGSSYDRSLFNSIYNGDTEITRTTVKATATAKTPRLSILCAGHTYKIMEMLQKEKKSSGASDGFISRFLFCAPQTLRITLKSVTSIPHNQYDVKHVLAAVAIINKHFRITDKSEFLTFEAEAFDLLSDTFSAYDQTASKYQLTNGFIRFIKN